MKPVLPEELSGLVDGVLDSARAAEILAALEQDARLQRQYEQLRAVDRDLTACAARLTHQWQASAATNTISAAMRSTLDPRMIAFATVAMLLVRIFSKLAPPLAGVALESLALTGVICAAGVWLIRVSNREVNLHVQQTAGAGRG